MTPAKRRLRDEATVALVFSWRAGFLPWAIERLREHPAEVVITDSMAPWGRLAARHLGIPCMTSSSTFAVHPGMDRSPAAMGELLVDVAGSLPAAAALELSRWRMRRRWNADPGGVMSILSNRADHTIAFTSRTFQPAADALADPITYVGTTTHSRAGDGARLPTLRRDGPLIYVSLGTLYNERALFLRRCLEACRDRPGPVLLSIGRRLDPADLGPLPDNATVERSVPQLAVLDRAALFITHGGMNSVSEALTRGVPMVLFPQTGDQPMVARRVQALGAGQVLRGREPRTDEIASAISAVLASSAATRASELGATLTNAGGAEAAASAIWRLAPHVPC